MQSQTYPADHFLFLNSPFAKSKDDPSNYISLLDDIKPRRGCRIVLAYGRSSTPHLHHVAALGLADIHPYSLFLKIDDDDVYRTNYVEKVVEDYQKNRWDFSGSHTQGLLHNTKWYPERRYTDLGLSAEDERLGVIPMMPSTYAFSRKAIDVLLTARLGLEIITWEDILWRRLLKRHGSLKIQIRRESNFAYQIHGKNYSGTVVSRK